MRVPKKSKTLRLAGLLTLMALLLLGDGTPTAQAQLADSPAGASPQEVPGPEPLWVARYNGPGNNYDLGYDIATDAYGGLYVTGHSSGYGTVAYDTQGTERWVARYNGPSNSGNWAYAIALDAQGNVYVTGRSDGSGTGSDYATIKYPASVPAAAPSLAAAQDTDAAAGVSLSIPQVYDATTQTPLPGLLIGGYQATLQYDGSLLQVLDVRHKTPFTDNGTTINNPGGNTLLSGVAPGGAAWPVQSAFVTLRLTGCTTDSVTLTPTVNYVNDSLGNPLQVDQPAARTYQRGDAKVNGAVNIADALFGAQYLVGIRGVGDDPANEVNAVNLASTKQDEAVDLITIADVLLIAQYLVGLRDDCFDLVPSGSPPPR